MGSNSATVPPCATVAEAVAKPASADPRASVCVGMEWEYRSGGYIAAVDSATLDRMAELAVGFGANVQPGQRVHVVASLGQEELTRAVVERAYKAGAVHVNVVYRDPYVQRARLQYGVEDALGYEPEWVVEMVRQHGKHHGATIALSGPTAPGLLEGIDPARIGRDRPPGRKESVENLNAASNNWTIVPCPTPGWANLVHSDLDPTEALDRLWQEMARVCRLDADDPVAAWHERIDQLHAASAALNERRFDAIHLEGPGTDLTVGLLPGSIWHGGGMTTSWGLDHQPNLPTEEVFTSPDPERVEGVVRSTRPRELDGIIVRDFEVRFKSGRAVAISAAANAEVLQAYVDRDAGAARLGELALVDGSGRVGPLDTVFYDTLIDENAASHIALGQGFEWAVEEADRERINSSEIHVDFMIGSPQVDVTGVTASGERVPVLRDGRWQI
jgi:aminopeptidase